VYGDTLVLNFFIIFLVGNAGNKILIKVFVVLNLLHH